MSTNILNTPLLATTTTESIRDLIPYYSQKTIKIQIPENQKKIIHFILLNRKNPTQTTIYYIEDLFTLISNNKKEIESLKY
jgi:hypothetical protein